MPPPASNDTGTAFGHYGSDWSRDLATLTFDVGGHGVCGWCGSSSSIRVPSLKFVIYLGRYGAWCESRQRWGTFVPNLGTLGLRVLEVIRYVRDGRTDCPLPYRREHNNVNAISYSLTVKDLDYLQHDCCYCWCCCSYVCAILVVVECTASQLSCCLGIVTVALSI